MWWIAIVAFVIITLIVFGVINSKAKHNRGDHFDGGGTQVGGPDKIPFTANITDKSGIRGEKLVNYHLRPLLRNDEYLLANVLLPLKNGHKIEIDCILISRKGIFCIETKHWVGHISGSDEDDYWLQEYDDSSLENRIHKNPVKQNEFHRKILDEKLNKRFVVLNVVLFVNLEDGEYLDSKYVYTLNEFKESFRSLPEDEINPVELKQIFQKLRPFVATEEQLIEFKNTKNSTFN